MPYFPKSANNEVQEKKLKLPRKLQGQK